MILSAMVNIQSLTKDRSFKMLWLRNQEAWLILTLTMNKLKKLLFSKYLAFSHWFYVDGRKVFEKGSMQALSDSLREHSKALRA